MESIRKQFSLDWLPSSQEAGKREQSPLTESSLDEARDFLYSSAIGTYLAKAPQQHLKLHDLARSVKVDVEQFKFEELWEVIKRLADRGTIEVEDIQATDGNYTIKLSKKS
jgi:hypothetical protein